MDNFLTRTARSLLHRAPLVPRSRVDKWSAKTLARLGDPKTVVDVGVGPGTPELYEAFPQALHVLVEPLNEFAEDLERISETYRTIIVDKAVGARPSTTDMHVPLKFPTHSSFYARTPLTSQVGTQETRKIYITTLNELMGEQDWPPPYGIKIDTEGFELEVVRGASEVLRSTNFLIAEVSIAERFEGSYRFAEFVSAMHDHHFGLHDIIRTVRRIDRNGGVQFMDCVFLPYR